jgi:proteasome accessory factor C
MPADTKTHRILRLILFLSNAYHKTKEDCTAFLEIKDTAFYSYCNTLKETGFDLRQKDGRYWIDYPEEDFRILQNILHFSDEETYLLSKAIDLLNEKTGCSVRLKNKLTAFLNQEKTIENYLLKEKSTKVSSIQNALKHKQQILLVNYSSGNSETVKNRLVEPFEFKDDFNLIWAFDTELRQNRQFKICRIEDIIESPLKWEYEHLHQSMPVDIFRNTGELNKIVELTLNLKARNLLIEEYPLAELHLTRIKPNRFELRVEVAKYEGPARFVMGLAENIQVNGDKGFHDFIRLKLEKISRLREFRS